MVVSTKRRRLRCPACGEEWDTTLTSGAATKCGDTGWLIFLEAVPSERRER